MGVHSYYSESWMKSSAVTELTRLGVDTRLAMGLQKPGGPVRGIHASHSSYGSTENVYTEGQYSEDQIHCEGGTQPIRCCIYPSLAPDLTVLECLCLSVPITQIPFLSELPNFE